MLLTSQQEDGDGLIQNIVTIFGEVSRKGLTEGLRNDTQVDNHRAFEVEHLREGLRSFKTKAEKRRRIPRSASQGKPRRIDAQSR